MYSFLEGTRIVEIGHILLAPYATQFLGDFGADVIKVEALDGDYYRQLGLIADEGMSVQWMVANRNKRSLSVDLKTPEGREVLTELIRSADVVVHNMRAPAIKRLGFDYEAVQAINPRSVYCAAVGYGQDGPYADQPAFDDIIQAWSGLTTLNGMHRGRPSFVPLAIVDLMVGQMLAIAMLAGLNHQKQTGKGCYIEAPMFESAVSVILNQHLNGHSLIPSRGELGYARVMSAHREPAPTKDGYIVHGVYKYEQWQAFLKAVGREDVLASSLMTDQQSMAAGIAYLYQIVWTEIMPERTTAEWQTLLNGLGIPSAPAMQLEDLENDPHLQAVGMFQEYNHPNIGRMQRVRSPYTVQGVHSSEDRHPP